MTTTRITSTQAARTFSDLLNRVKYRGEEFVVERGGVAMCKIAPVAPTSCSVAHLADVLASLPRPDAGYFEAVTRATRRQPKMPITRRA